MSEEQRFTIREFVQMPLNKTYCEALSLDTDTTLGRLLELYAELRSQFDPKNKPQATPSYEDAKTALEKLLHRSPAELREQQRQWDFFLSLAARANCTMQELDQARAFGLLPPTSQPLDPPSQFD